MVIPAAGLGTRLLSATKELPKEMMPVFTKNSRGGLCMKPLLQLLFEQFYEIGFRQFCFVVGRGKRAIEDHFTPDWGFINLLKDRGKEGLASSLEEFYREIFDSTVVWLNQPNPKGFGDAVLIAEPFVGNEPFFLSAGDTYVISKNDEHIKRMIETFSPDIDALLLLQEVEDPRQYGVAVVRDDGDTLRVLKVIEKPESPPSNLAIMPLYIFRPSIFDALRRIKPGVGGELQLTDGIQRLIDTNRKVVAIKLSNEDLRLDIGTPETYWEALRLSYQYFTRKGLE